MHQFWSYFGPVLMEFVSVFIAFTIDVGCLILFWGILKINTISPTFKVLWAVLFEEDLHYFELEYGLFT